MERFTVASTDPAQLTVGQTCPAPYRLALICRYFGHAPTGFRRLGDLRSKRKREPAHFHRTDSSPATVAVAKNSATAAQSSALSQISEKTGGRTNQSYTSAARAAAPRACQRFHAMRSAAQAARPANATNVATTARSTPPRDRSGAILIVSPFASPLMITFR